MPNNVKIIQGAESDEKGFKFYTFGLERAMHSLATDWKVYLDSDEFVKDLIKTDNLKKRLAYSIQRIDLFGNIYTQILHSFLRYRYRIHFGIRRLLGDDTVPPTYSGKIHLGGIRYLMTDYIRHKPSFREEPIFTTDFFPGQFTTPTLLDHLKKSVRNVINNS